jgi:hypothetical protein
VSMVGIANPADWGVRTTVRLGRATIHAICLYRAITIHFPMSICQLRAILLASDQLTGSVLGSAFGARWILHLTLDDKFGADRDVIHPMLR